MVAELESYLRILKERGVILVDPRQIYIDDTVKIDRISAGSVLYPGTRLIGARTFVGPGAKVGTEGPTVLENSVLGENVEVASGVLKGAVLLSGSRVGPNAHLRGGTLLEEETSVAHSVGLKHSILMCFVTLGSLINFCDGLISGGSSRQDHTEIGSGFFHFNFTPWGQQGDKATPSLVGDVTRGVFLREARIFLGGNSGMVGPQKIGFGSIAAAGQIIREVIPEMRLVYRNTPEINEEINLGYTDPPEMRTELNLEYIGQLLALKAWYEEVRLFRIPSSVDFDHLRIVTKEATDNIRICIDERIHQLQQFLTERTGIKSSIEFGSIPCPLSIESELPYTDHVTWVRGLSDSAVNDGVGWLDLVSRDVCLK